MNIKIIPVGERVLLELDPVEERKVGGGLLYAADKHSENVRLGTIIAVGDEVKRWEPGHRVIVSYHVGAVIDTPLIPTKSADSLRICNAGEIWGFVKED